MSLHNYGEDEESCTGGRAAAIKSITDLNVIVGSSLLLQSLRVSLLALVQISNC